MTKQKTRPTEPAGSQHNRKLLIVTIAAVTAVLAAVMLTVPNGAERHLQDRQEFNVVNRPTLGDPHSGGEVILFADYSCPSCRTFETQQFGAIKRELIDTGRAHLTFLQSPFINASSHRAAIAAECVYRTTGNDAFWTYTRALYDRQGPENVDWATPQLLRDTAGNAGVDLRRYDACLTTPAARASVQADLAQHVHADMRGTPTVFVNGYRTPAGGIDILEALQRHPN